MAVGRLALRASLTLVVISLVAGCATPTPPGYAFAWGSNASGEAGDGTQSTTRLAPFPVSALGRVNQVAAGGGHALAVKADGTIWAWGNNGSGQLGDGSRESRRLPVAVLRPGGARGVAGGGGHSLGVWQDGSVWAWGRGTEGQLGNGAAADSAIPVQVALASATRLAAGARHSLAIVDGRVWAWGSNSSRQLGTGAAGQSPTPALVPGTSGIVAIAAGEAHSLALGSDGALWAWGANGAGQLGDGSTADRSAPTRVTGLPPIAAVAAASNSSVALARDGTVWAWGDNTFFAIGSASLPASAVPLQVSGVQEIIEVAAGGLHMLALGRDGRVRAWGYGGPGQLGDGGTTNSQAPTTAIGLPQAVRIAAGGNLSLAITLEIDVLGWGSGAAGSIGELAPTRSATPVAIGGLGTPAAVSAGTSHSVALGAGGNGWGWGSNEHGQLGLPTASTGQHTPIHLATVSGRLVALEAGERHGLALDADGDVRAWGNNVYGQLGDGVVGDYTWRMQPQRVGLPGPAAAIAAGGTHSLAALRDGTVRAWGENARGQIGDGTGGTTPPVGVFNPPFYRPRPVTVRDLTGVRRVAAGFQHSLALGVDGRVWSWGDNVAGQLGRAIPGGVVATVPGAVAGLADVTAIAAGHHHSLALRSDGTVWSWGSNSRGQLGTGGGSASSPSPAQVPGLSNVIAIAAGQAHSMALRSDGTVWTWGANDNGQLGSGGFDAGRATPAQVPGLTRITAIAAGASHSLAIRRAAN
jgi:alpha-tubulin suppressor-like RCC1 family protein